MTALARLRAAAHEVRCWECRVTWTSWTQRLIGMKRGHTPKLSKRHRALVERARRAEAAIERALVELDMADYHEKAGVLENRIRAALTRKEHQ